MTKKETYPQQQRPFHPNILMTDGQSSVGLDQVLGSTSVQGPDRKTVVAEAAKISVGRIG
jgi:hypothetical protein